MAFFADLMAAIPAYTGLSPVSFFTIAALILALYYLVSGFFAAPKHTYVPMEPLPPPVQLGDVTEEELRAYDGTDSSKPLLMAIKGQIYDVSQSRMFYGSGGPYALFAGKDASRALAKMSFEEQDLNGNLEGLSAYEMDALQDWEWKFMSKYVKVGQIPSKVRDVPVVDAATEAKSREFPVVDTADEAKSQEAPVGDAVTIPAETEDSKKVDEEGKKPVVSEDVKVNEGGEKAESVEKLNEEAVKAIAKEETAATE